MDKIFKAVVLGQGAIHLMAKDEFQARQTLFNLIAPLADNAYMLTAMCSTCKDQPSPGLHYCPYASEICHDHSEDFCDCCDDCYTLCARDI